MNFFTTTTLFTRKLLLIFLLVFSFSFNSSGQGTPLTQGDIMVLQIDEGNVGNDRFFFVTFVNLVAGTTIYFTDCGVFPSGGFIDTGVDPTYTSCPEGATKFVASSAIDAGSIFQYQGSVAEPQFSSHTDALITGSLDFTFAGDQVIVFQDDDGAGGDDPSQNPNFIFILNANNGNFGADLNPSAAAQDGTSIPTGLTALNSPAGSATAMAVGTGTGEFDNVIFNGTGLVPFVGADLAAKVLNAKIAILAAPGNPGESNGANWVGINNTAIAPGNQPYIDSEALLLSQGGNILPVELTSFNGRPKVTTIDLQWVTASETNNDY
ncbi:MAG: hypothetical protein AB8F94_22385, partial [Saprospiraceae bacterium]